MRWALVMGFTLAGAAARADSNDADDRNEATKLFDEGRKLKEAGDAAGACVKFERSYKLERAPGTALNLAACAEAEEEWRRAWELYDTAAKVFDNRRDPRAKFALERAYAIVIAHPEVAQPETEPAPPPEPAPRPITTTESRTGLKVAAGVAVGVAVLGAIGWGVSYAQVENYEPGSATDVFGDGLTVPADCNAEVATDFGGRFEAACEGYARQQWLIPTTLIAAAVGTTLVIYLMRTKPKTIVVTPSVSAQSTSVSARFEW